MLKWIDRHAAIFVVLGLMGLTSLGGWTLAIAREVQANASNQLINRAANVESWCGGINEGRGYDRKFVRTVTHGRVVYTLGDKDCSAIIRRTLESPKRKAAITVKGNPLTYRIAKELGLLTK